MANAVNAIGGRIYKSITPSDSVDITPANPMAIICNGAGNLALVGNDDVVVTVGVIANKEYDFSPKRINSTNTTATGITAIYAG